MYMKSSFKRDAAACPADCRRAIRRWHAVPPASCLPPVVFHRAACRPPPIFCCPPPLCRAVCLLPATCNPPLTCHPLLAVRHRATVLPCRLPARAALSGISDIAARALFPALPFSPFLSGFSRLLPVFPGSFRAGRSKK